MPVRIQRKRTKGFNLQAASPNGLPVVYVGRRTRWGNPFAIDQYGPLGRKPIDAKGAVGHFRAMLSDNELREIVRYPSNAEIRRELAGKNLACWCKIGDPCHADVLLKLANEPEVKDGN